MIEYENKNNRELIKIISDYIAIQSFDPNVEGIFLYSYYDDCNCFEIGTFYKEYNKLNLSSYKINESMVTFYNFDISELELDAFNDFNTYTILFDRNKKLCNRYDETSKVNTDTRYMLSSNYLKLPSEFIIDIHNTIDEKIANVDINDMEGSMYILLIDFYKNIIDRFDYNDLIDSIKNHIMLNGEQMELHNKALEEAIKGRVYIKN